MKCWFLFFILVPAIHSFSQNVVIKGNVTDKDGIGLFAVNVYPDQLKGQGIITDMEGNFTLQIPQTYVQKGNFLIAALIGYKQQRIAIDSIDLSRQLQIVLTENATTLNEVKVEGRKSITREFSVKEMDKLKIYTSPLSSADPLKALAALPSSTNTDETANPELRGSQANRTRVFFNGVPVSNPVKNSQINGIGYFSLFNTELIKNENIYPSNPPLTYGNTSAGIIDIETEDEVEDNSFSISASLASVGTSVTRKFNKNKFIQAYGNLTFSDAFLAVNSNVQSKLKSFRSDDIGFNFHQDISKDASWNFYNYLISEGSDVLLNLYTWTDHAKAGTIRDFSILNFKVEKTKYLVGINLGSNFSKSDFSFGNILSMNQQKHFYSSVNFKYLFSENLNLQTGLSNENQNFSFNDQVPVFYYALSPDSRSYSADTNLSYNLPEAYSYIRWKPASKIIWGAGFRANIVSSDKYNSYLSFQTNLKYNFLKKHSLLITGGRYHSISEPTYYQKEIRSLSSDQVSVEYAYETNRTLLNLAIYYKIETGDTVNEKKINGFEIYLEQYFFHNLVKLSMSNTYLTSEIYNKEQVYNASNSAGYFLVTTCSYLNNKQVNISVSWTYHEGKPFTRITNSVYNTDAGFYQPIYPETINTEKFNSYNSVNLSASKIIDWDSKNIIVFFSVQNLLNFKNQEGLTYSRDYKKSSFEFYQKRSFYFGCMLRF